MKIGFVGWRGMVGSVLMDRMRAEGDFNGFEPVFFTTSQIGQKAPEVGLETGPLVDAFDPSRLKAMDVVVTCQGGSYSERVLPELRKEGWQGFWIDAASTFRMDEQSVIVLDPVNLPVIEAALSSGCHTLVGGNCTVSLMLMGLAGLFQHAEIEWLSSMTYQAASGAGSRYMCELLEQMGFLHASVKEMLADPATGILNIDRRLTHAMRNSDYPKDCTGVPLAGSLIPWIDRPVEEGMTREEWKGHAETNKILQNDPAILVDGICVRVGSMRCHSQAITIKLKRDLPLDEVEGMIRDANEWVSMVPNTKEESMQALSPAAVSGTLMVPVGRLRKMKMGPEYLAAFTVGDQLLWGAAEPLRRMLQILLHRFI
jgi:aspartate-semialdehyde dehydrogenase